MRSEIGVAIAERWPPVASREELRQRVYVRCGLDTADGMVTPSVVNDTINEALHFIETVAPWWWLDATETLTTVAGTQSVTVSGDSQGTRGVSFADQTGRLERVGVSVIDEADDTPGKPSVWAEHGSTLLLYPTPDAAYSLTHRYTTIETDLSQDDTEPLLPSQYQGALVDYAAFLVLRRTHDSERAQEALAGYQAWEIRMRDNVRRGMGPKVPRVRAGSPL